jgi:hypothetical protein
MQQQVGFMIYLMSEKKSYIRNKKEKMLSSPESDAGTMEERQ